MLRRAMTGPPVALAARSLITPSETKRPIPTITPPNRYCGCRMTRKPPTSKHPSHEAAQKPSTPEDATSADTTTTTRAAVATATAPIRYLKRSTGRITTPG
jgi:hypothetical protein